MSTLPPLVLSVDPWLQPTQIMLTSTPVVALRSRAVTVDELPQLFDAGYQRLAEFGPVGPGYAIYDGDPLTTFDLEIGFPTCSRANHDDVLDIDFPSGPALGVSHMGPFEGLGDSWQRLLGHASESGLASVGRYLEIYVTDPSTHDAAQLRTDLILPLAN